MKLKNLITKIFPNQHDLIAQEIDSVENQIAEMSARADEHEALAQQLRAGVRRLRGGSEPQAIKLPYKVAA